MDDFLDRYRMPMLNQDQVNYLKSPISPKEIEAVIKSLPTTTTTTTTTKAQGQMVLVQNSTRLSNEH